MSAPITNELNKIIKPALQLVEFILERKGLKGSDLIKNTKVVANNEGVSVLMPDYADFVDSGRKPGRMPPIASIIKWVREKHLDIPKGYTLESFAFAIGRKIAKKGTKGRFFYDEMVKRVFELVADYINKLIDTKLKQI